MRKSLPSGVWALGFVSLFMDASSEMIHSLLPVFMVSALGASVSEVGIVEGIAESTALITKIFSGALSDYLGKRKPLILIGYGLAAASKPFFPLANHIATVLGARFFDRVGKGIRGAPRDALIGDITPAGQRGAAFGLRQTLDTVGAVIGPLMAVGFMLWLGSSRIRSVLWIACLPAILCVLILALGVREPPRHVITARRERLRLRDIRHSSKAYWYLVALGAALTLARFSEAFLILKALHVGLSEAWVPLAAAIMSIAYASSAYPAGALSDRISRKNILLAGIGFLIAANIVLGLAHGIWSLALGVALWGMHMGFSQGLLAAMVSDTAPGEWRGTAYGIFNLASGIATLAASIIAGVIWDSFGPAATFFTSAAFAIIALAMLFFARAKK